MPSDPKALMLLAAKTNGLTGDDMKPWHLKATYKLLDEKGSVADQGTYEEFWVSPAKYKIIFASSGGILTIYGTDHGPINSGYEAEIDTLISTIRVAYVSPLASVTRNAKLTFSAEHRSINGADQLCISTSSIPPLSDQPARLLGTYCFDPTTLFLQKIFFDIGAIRSSFIWNHPVVFQDRSLPGDLELEIAGKGSLIAHLDSIEPVTASDEPAFIPPSGAGSKDLKIYGSKVGGNIFGPASVIQQNPSNRRISISSGVAEGLLTNKVAPAYPPDANAAGVEGTVVLEALISKQGHIESLHVVSGPPQLMKAALDAVKQWTYKPFLINGESVEVNTTINVVFKLNR